ncbi:hypothetical protein ACOUV0_15750 [Acinetobacter baumannii]|uniref:hypothetical protein n=1 Tax=Acinetobacter calcoaceticus/baumannii complex TaxID=909768 RepID=UPI00092BEFE6|nr:MULTISPECIES: hypothetical protein [Acinetobacter calcoaceticus/baumannii complex]EKW4080145.1 hypothetical protein [Acinetobacter baumannii]MDV7377670.1 hypothetical protein [Acinetobacter baumannii]OJK06305.1 hypothetical protein BRY75_13390 [Acinetobacter baumannii]WPP76727.1 hypothetical protein SOI71_15595 [Acinetobacter pittii]HBI8871140.1 hypothetical protein [Acinetobacter baumannii]
MWLGAACLSGASVDHTMLNELPAEQAYRIIEFDPIVMVAKRGIDGLPNLMTGFHMMIQHDPPLVGAVIGS